MARENPYKEFKNTTALKWMIKNKGKQMIFTFLFVLMFILVPWIGPWRIEEIGLRLLISGVMVVINFLITFLHPYLVYRDCVSTYKRWEKLYGDKK